MHLLFLILISVFGWGNSKNLDVIRAGCMKEMAQYENAKAICDCQEKNLKRRMTKQLMFVLAKTYLGQSIEKEMDTIEGATVVTTYDNDIKALCIKNPKYDVGRDTLQISYRSN